jgi:hypothetical protein
MHRRIAAIVGPVAAVLLAAGCWTPPKPPPVEEPRVEAPPAEEHKPSIDLTPVKSGDYIVYPLKWRNADETAHRLHTLLYPKYGPFIEIVPDPQTNSLLIYLPPKESRFQGAPGYWMAPLPPPPNSPYYPPY